MSNKDRKLSKALKRAGLGSKYWKRFNSKSTYEKVKAKFIKEYAQKE